MRRWAAALAGVLTLVLAGCGDLPEGVDGDLTDDWAPMPAAQQFRPQPGTCHPELTRSATAENYAPIPCTGPHVAETISVTDLAGAQGLATPADSLDRAWADCSRRATAFLGADWRTGWVVMQPVLPGKAAWSGGARWIRCDVVETSPVDGALTRRSKTLKGGLRAGSSLRMTCANPTIKDDSVTQMHPVACAGKHKSEFAGLFETKQRRSADLSATELEKGCDATIARFAGIPNDSSVPNRVGWLGFPPDEAAWELGDRAIRCFLWLNGDSMTGSYRNAGTQKLKIHYVYR